MGELLEHRVGVLERTTERLEGKMGDLSDAFIRYDERSRQVVESVDDLSKQTATIRDLLTGEYSGMSDRAAFQGVVTDHGTGPVAPPVSFAKSLHDLPAQAWILAALFILTMGGVVTPVIAQGVMDVMLDRSDAIEAAP